MRSSLVSVIRRHFTEAPYSQSIDIGKEVELRCLPPDGNPLPQTKWFKNNSPIDLTQPSNFRYTFFSLSLLSLLPFNEANKSGGINLIDNSIEIFFSFVSGSHTKGLCSSCRLEAITPATTPVRRRTWPAKGRRIRLNSKCSVSSSSYHARVNFVSLLSWT